MARFDNELMAGLFLGLGAFMSNFADSKLALMKFEQDEKRLDLLENADERAQVRLGLDQEKQRFAVKEFERRTMMDNIKTFLAPVLGEEGTAALIAQNNLGVSPEAQESLIGLNRQLIGQRERQKAESDQAIQDELSARKDFDRFQTDENLRQSRGEFELMNEFGMNRQGRPLVDGSGLATSEQGAAVADPDNILGLDKTTGRRILDITFRQLENLFTPDEFGILSNTPEQYRDIILRKSPEAQELWNRQLLVNHRQFTGATHPGLTSALAGSLFDQGQINEITADEFNVPRLGLDDVFPQSQFMIGRTGVFGLQGQGTQLFGGSGALPQIRPGGPLRDPTSQEIEQELGLIDQFISTGGTDIKDLDPSLSPFGRAYFNEQLPAHQENQRIQAIEKSQAGAAVGSFFGTISSGLETGFQNAFGLGGPGGGGPAGIGANIGVPLALEAQKFFGGLGAGFSESRRSADPDTLDRLIGNIDTRTTQRPGDK